MQKTSCLSTTSSLSVIILREYYKLTTKRFLQLRASHFALLLSHSQRVSKWNSRAAAKLLIKLLGILVEVRIIN